VISGIADIGWSTHGFYPGRFPLSNLVSLPYIGIGSSLEGSLGLWHIYQTFPEVQAEYKDVKMIALTTHQGAPVATKEKILTLDELKGLKIRTTAGNALRWVKAAGATPVVMPPFDIYTSMEKGVIDGWCIDLIGAEGFRIYEVTNYYLKPYYYVDAFWTVMNQRKWDSLPPDIQQAIDVINGEWTIRNNHGPKWDAGDPEAIARMGITPDQINTLSDEDIARATELAEGVWAEYIAELEAKGLPAQKIFDELKKFLDEFE